jgi:hypothetical protein
MDRATPLASGDATPGGRKPAVRRTLLALLTVIAIAPPLHGQEESGDTFYFKATLGYVKPLITALSDELDKQGLGEGLGQGGGLTITLGRSFLDRSWGVELSAHVSLYTSFKYLNEYEDFYGDMRHYGFGAVVTKRFPLQDGALVPVLGIGGAYGRTELVSGGGKLDVFEAIALARVERRIRDNVGLVAELAYTSGLTEDTFDSPYLENVSGDVVFTSDYEALEARFASLEFRVGVIVWLKKRVSYGGR